MVKGVRDDVVSETQNELSMLLLNSENSPLQRVGVTVSVASTHFRYTLPPVVVDELHPLKVV